MSDEDLKAELERLGSENAALKKGTSGGARMKLNAVALISYGLRL